MFVMTLDVRATHANNPDCPMRIMRKPDGGWMCVDCGFDIIHKRIEVSEGRNLIREMLANKQPNPLGYTPDDYSGVPDLNTCPGCGGPADNGHDRCVPPSPYFCTKCERVPDGEEGNRG